MPKHRTQTVLALAVGGIALVPVALLALWGFMFATATPLHPIPADIPAVARGVAPDRWGRAVESGREVVRAGMTAQNLPGVSVAVGTAGRIVWAEGFGWADLEQEIPVAPDTRFRIGTASTALTSAAVGLLIEQGRLRLDDEIQVRVPEFPKKPWPMTLRQVMGHTAGLRSDGGDEGPLLAERCERPIDGLPAFAGEPLMFEPGTEYRYSRYGWILVSAAVEAAAGEPFPGFMRRQVFEPAGLEHTGPDSAAEPAADRATPYFPRFAADPRYGLHLMRPIDGSCYAGGGAFLSTPSDLVRFALAVQGGRLLRPETVALLQTPQRLPSGRETGYGLGWKIETVELAGDRIQAVGHHGDVLGGRVASLLTFPRHGLVVSVVSNISYADTFGLAVKIAQAFARQGTAASPAFPASQPRP